MLFRETSARNTIKLRLSVISILLLSKTLQGASITSQVACLHLLSGMFKLPKWHVYNLQVMGFWLTNMLRKGCKNVKTGAFSPPVLHKYTE